jgi:hypothetical protein
MYVRAEHTPVGTVTARATNPTTRRARRGRKDPRRTYGQPPRRPRPLLVRGTILRIPDMRFRHANIRRAAHRPAPPRRVVVNTHPAHRRPGQPVDPSLPCPAARSSAPGQARQGRFASHAISLRLTLDPPTRPRFRQRSRQGGNWPTPSNASLPQHKPDTHRNAVLTLDRAVPHQVRVRTTSPQPGPICNSALRKMI